MYKLSKYNVTNTYNNITYLWNTFSGALISLDKNSVDYIDRFSRVDDKTKEFSILKNNGFIVNENIDETGLILSHEKSSLYSLSQETMYIVVSLGLGCNYNCVYCFQNEHNGTMFMDTSTAQDVAAYICKNIENRNNLKRINIKWFGGEPLLYMDALEIISKEIIKTAEKRKLEYMAGIITNGRFLNLTYINKLKKLKVTKAQITIDGMSENYCANKRASEEDFFSVIENVKMAASMINVTIRLNIAENNAEEAIKITDYLLTKCSLKNKIKIYFAYIKKFKLSKEEGESNYKKYVDNYLQWLKYVVHKYGFVVAKGTYPLRKITSCGYIRTGSLCIGCNGMLFKCESCFDEKDKIIGDIWTGRYYNKVEEYYKIPADKRKNGICLKCSYLPVCMGGCVNDELNNDYEMECKAHAKMLFTLKLAEGGILL